MSISNRLAKQKGRGNRLTRQGLQKDFRIYYVIRQGRGLLRGEEGYSVQRCDSGQGHIGLPMSECRGA